MRTFALAVSTFQSTQKQHNVDACSFHSKYLFFKAEVQQQRVLFVRSVDTSFTIQREEKSPNSRERLKHINVLWHAVYIILPSHLPDAVCLLLCSCLSLVLFWLFLVCQRFLSDWFITAFVIFKYINHNAKEAQLLVFHLCSGISVSLIHKLISSYKLHSTIFI